MISVSLTDRLFHSDFHDPSLNERDHSGMNYICNYDGAWPMGSKIRVGAGINQLYFYGHLQAFYGYLIPEPIRRGGNGSLSEWAMAV
jgi:hypothetical protein